MAKSVLEHRSPMSLKTELIQVAAVAVAWIEALDKRQRALENTKHQESEILKQQIDKNS